ncbi:hypothetical protein F2Q69_00023470 [Brassica cretica]|uniref:Cellulose synthase RING-type zinc finger domain-containing protein n=1 Tax=Brassica cretica TaxID=69181 RepID=A0A8S9Q6P5_BRACR|nr:hypothetical protein F2Q69_00023470 [Brassica cretica]
MEPNTMTSFDDRHRHSPFSSKICRICSYEVKDGDNGQTFVACHVCAFPVCKPCYEYERRNGENCCPQCNTPYKPNKGSPRISGDEEEENNGPVDSDGELDIKNRKDASSIHQNFAYGSCWGKRSTTEAIFYLEDIEEGLEGYDEHDNSSLMSLEKLREEIWDVPCVHFIDVDGEARVTRGDEHELTDQRSNICH